MNAKELLISKLGVDDNTIKVYAAAMALGIPPTVVFYVMTNPTVKALTELTKSNVFNSKQQTLTLEVLINKILNISKIPSKPTGNAEKDRKNALKVKLFNEEFANSGISYANNEITIKTVALNANGTAQNTSIKADTVILEDLNNLFKAANEFSLLGQLFGVNQGVKPTIEEIIGYRDKLEKFMRNTVMNFNFNEFIEAVNYCIINKIDPMDNKLIASIIKDYDVHKTAFNIPAIIAYNPTFSAQMMSVVGTVRLLNKGTLRFKLIENVTSLLESAGFKSSKTALNKKKGAKITQFTNDVLASLFLATNPEFSKLHSKDKTIDLGNLTGRQKFITWMNEKVIPDLKIKYSDNLFLDKLIIDEVKDSVTGKLVKQAKLTINTSGKTNSLEATPIIGAFTVGLNELKSETYQDFNILELLEAYNFITYRDADTGKAWGKYIAMSKGVKNTLSGNYVEFLKQAKDFSVSSTSQGIMIYNTDGFRTTLNLLDVLKYSGFIDSVLIRDQSVSNEVDYDFNPEEEEDTEISEEVDEEMYEDIEEDNEDFEEDEKPVFKKATIKNKMNAKGEIYKSELEISTTTYTEDKKAIKSSKTYPINSNSVNGINFASVKVLEHKTSKDASTKSETLRAMKLLSDRLEQLNPGINLYYVDSGFSKIDRNDIFLNLSNADTDTVIHEFGHALLALLRYDNPNLFKSLMDATDKMPNAERITDLYKEDPLYKNSPESIKEEIIIDTLVTISTNGNPLSLKDINAKLDLDEALKVISEKLENATGTDIPLNTPLEFLLDFMKKSMPLKSLVDIAKSNDEIKEMSAIDSILADLNIKCEN